MIGDDEAKLLNKLQENAVPLGKYVDGKIHRGVLTGLNEAFVIDEETKNRLIAEDPKSAEVIKPFLAGRDIKRYQPPGSDKYLIFFIYYDPDEEVKTVITTIQVYNENSIKIIDFPHIPSKVRCFDAKDLPPEVLERFAFNDKGVPSISKDELEDLFLKYGLIDKKEV